MADCEDPVLDALNAVVRGLAQNITRLGTVIERIDELREQRRSGMTYCEIAEQTDRPLIVELLSQNLAVLQHAGYRFRKAEAEALHAEGVTMDRIAELFGVTRQRVSALLRPDVPRDPLRRS